MKVYFNLPGLFEKFHIVKQTILLYENYPYIFRDNFIISSFYGSNGGVANGGRNSGHFNNEKEVENFCKEHNLCPTIIMSNLFANEQYFPDDYASRIITTFDKKNTYFCLSNLYIEKWLENQGIRRGQFILSTTACFDFEAIIKKTDQYKRIVLSEYMINDWKTISLFPEHTRNKLEIIVNTICPNNCKSRKNHYEHISNLNINNNDITFKCIHESYCGNGNLYEILNAPQVVTIDMINTYLNLGINHFKIQGRTNDDVDLIETFAYYLIKPKYQLMFREICHENSVNKNLMSYTGS
jgi:hypothetical protein